MANTYTQIYIHHVFAVKNRICLIQNSWRDDIVSIQEKHHHKRTFMEEYLEFLKLFEIEYDERYVFKSIE